jgi:hypothetical protein
MRLSWGWHGLLLFWIGVLSLGGIGAGTLQALGPPVQSAASVGPGEPGAIQLVSLVPDASSAIIPASAPAVEAPNEAGKASAKPENPGAAPPVSVTLVASPAFAPASASPIEVPGEAVEASALPAGEAMPKSAVTVSSDTPALASGDPPAAQAAKPAIVAEGEGLQREREAPAAERMVLLRVARDARVCPKTACLRWHVVQPRTRPPPRTATLDFARLRLAPGLREAAEGGEIELFIDAVEQHRTVNGRENVIFVATSLAGVTPHDKSP